MWMRLPFRVAGFERIHNKIYGFLRNLTLCASSSNADRENERWGEREIKKCREGGRKGWKKEKSE